MALIRSYLWQEIGQIQDKGGVYAWYFSPELSDLDVDELIAKVERVKQHSPITARQLIEAFLESNIFRYFRESPYQARLFGTLKPKYVGHFAHEPTISDSLITRLLERPTRLATIKQVLMATVPQLASPLYVGMAKRLSRRIAQHKKLIEYYRSTGAAAEKQDESLEQIDERDHSFAREIASRAIPPTRLVVLVCEVPTARDDEFVDIENILNRIHFPLFGRN
jgi:hypothetical protein